MSRQHLEDAIQSVLSQGNKCFVPYIMAGDGGLDQLVPRLEFLQNAGATMIEIGIPFSDPAADGPVIQAAGVRALKGGTTLRGILETLKNVRETVSVPLLFMTYLNPILAVGLDYFAEQCAAIGIDACIIPDVPLEEEHEIKPYLQKHDIALIRLATLTSPPERLEAIAEGAEGFLYAVTVKGVTGVRREFENHVTSYMEALKKVCPVPVFAGFGISTKEHVKNMSAVCDGVIVGSQIVNDLHNGNEEDIITLIQAANSYSAIK
ncbi:tryptophan synthase subunit alpha [Bacillus massiliigorillae]|uniref:tryptophan synthase subunit alpha n=1 Tax=Bacillus massiliigorillae TaxID=1243664 RepID=UPI00039CC6FD|nr:tryptophan synthase subunit alpha [Bacillus massiliigorillae]